MPFSTSFSLFSCPFHCFGSKRAMSEENSWVDFSVASPWEANVGSIEEVFDSFHIGTQLLGMHCSSQDNACRGFSLLSAH